MEFTLKSYFNSLCIDEISFEGFIMQKSINSRNFIEKMQLHRKNKNSSPEKNLLIVSGVPCVRKKNQNLINFGNAQNDLITFIPSSQRQEGYVARFL